MTALQRVVAVVLTVSFITFIAFFGRLPIFRRTPIGFLNRLILINVPNVLCSLDVTVTGGRIARGTKSLGNYLLHDKHPLVIIFFLSLISGSVVLFVPRAWSLLPVKHHVIIPMIVPLPYIFTYLSARVRPSSHITVSNHREHMRFYPYDKVLYHPDNICRTCLFAKPARSKHCSICKTCVARADHHCIWVNNCLGRGNYRWFLALLLSTGILLAYGAYLSWLILSPQIKAHIAAYPSPNLRPSPSLPQVWLDHMSRYFNLAMNFGGASIAGVGMLALFTSPMPLGLLAYHIYLIWAGMTTNESSKWSDLRDDIADGIVYLGKRKPLLFSPYSSTSIEGQELGVDSMSEPRSTWPVRCRQLMVRTKDGKPPNVTPAELVPVLDESGWRRCRGLAEMENAYDLGFWDNLWEALL